MRLEREARLSPEDRERYRRHMAGNKWLQYEAAKQDTDHLTSRETEIYRRRLADELGI